MSSDEQYKMQEEKLEVMILNNGRKVNGEDMSRLANSLLIRKYLLSIGDIIERRKELQRMLRGAGIPQIDIGAVCMEYQGRAGIDLGYSLNKKF